MSMLRLYRVILPVGDLEPAAHFYSALFGQSGARADLYRYFKINAEAIVAAAFEALEAVGR